jgi:MFS transporter, putative metabolite:H+ symporter
MSENRQVTRNGKVVSALLEERQVNQSAEIGAALIARLERLPISRIHVLARLLIGCATFFDAYTSLSIAYALPVLVRDWHLAPRQAGFIISIGYVGQLIGALSVGWLAERIGRLKALTLCIAIYATMNIACIFSWSLSSLALCRFIQGLGVGGEVPVASAYINEFSKAQGRGKFFLIYQSLFSFGLLGCGLFGYLLIPIYGWRAMFIVGALPALLIAPMRLLLPESPRWLISKGKEAQAAEIILKVEIDLERRGVQLPEPLPARDDFAPTDKPGKWRELFSPFYRRRTFLLWSMWFIAYLVNNGIVTWLPTLYMSIFHMHLSRSLLFSFTTNAVSVFSSLACAFYIDKIGRRLWYILAFFGGASLLLLLGVLGATSAIEVLIFATMIYTTIQTITLSLNLYTGELYPTRIRAIGGGVATAWLRLGSVISPMIVGIVVSGYGIRWVFILFGMIAAVAGVIVTLFAVETKGKTLEALSP